MKQKKLGRVTYSMMFKISKERETNPTEYHDFMWSVLRKWDKLYPEAFCEHAYSEDTELGEETGDAWYDWHGFLSRKTLEKATKEVFAIFGEVKEIEVYKDVEIGWYANGYRRGKIARC